MSDDITATDYSDTDCPAPAVGGLDDWKSRGSKLAAEELEYQLNQCPPDTLFYMAHMRALGWLYSQAARISQLEAGLGELAMQKKTDEVEDEGGDVDYAYDTMIDRARAILKGQS
jgi:hypothetical protein